jgi:hypothetical protein
MEKGKAWPHSENESGGTSTLLSLSLMSMTPSKLQICFLDLLHNLASERTENEKGSLHSGNRSENLSKQNLWLLSLMSMIFVAASRTAHAIISAQRRQSGDLR